MSITSKIRFALIQMLVSSNKIENINKAKNMIKTAVEKGVNFVVLPECFNSPYSVDSFAKYAEEIPNSLSECRVEINPTSKFLFEEAKNNHIYLLGCFPERCKDSLYNTAIVIDPNGKLLCKYRKNHLFDIDIPSRITFQESKTLSPGSEIIVFDTEYCKIGLAICYDIRFPILSNIMRDRSASILIYPGSFNLTTGPLHWELLLRSRAVENELYTIGCSPARDMSEGVYHSYGHSMVVNPWGEVINTCDEKENIVYSDIDLNVIDEVRSNIPILKQMRNDLYEVVDKTK